jgi:Tol biopolymer transport system component
MVARPRSILSPALAALGVIAMSGCGGETTNPEPTTGTVMVTVTTTGSGSDADGYTVATAGNSQSIGANDNVTFSSVAAGSQTVVLSEIAQQCEPDETSKTVDVTAGQTATTTFAVDCVGNFAIWDLTNLDFLDGDGQLIHLTPGNTLRIGLWEWSPDGSQIVFELDDDTQTDLWVVNADGTGLGALTETANQDELMPDWSPNGMQLVFARRDVGTVVYDLWTMNADGSGAVAIAADGSINWKPRWSPGGTHILFASTRTGVGEHLWLAAADGTGPIRLTTKDGTNPVWSSGGAQIAFESTRDGDQEVYVMQADGSNQTNLSNNAQPDFSPSWFPDGQEVLYGAAVTIDSYHIFSAAADGSGTVQLTTGDSQTNQLPHASSDGSQVLFASDRSGSFALYVMDRDGSNVRLVWDSGFGAKWRPGQ